MQRVMQTDAAVFRTQETLDDGVKKITEIYKTFDQVSVTDRSMIWNSCVSSLSYYTQSVSDQPMQ